MTGLRMRIAALVFVLVVAVTVSVFAVVRGHHRAANRGGPVVSTAASGAFDKVPRIVFRNDSRGQFGVLATVALTDPGGPRALTATKCDRIAATATRTLCLALDRSTVLYFAQVLDQQLHPIRTLSLAGIPSRARLSADGRLASTTAFTAVGDSYASAGFSTRTFVGATAGAAADVNLESYALVDHGRRIRPADRNFWGVTFAADDTTFYATVAFGGQTHLVRGDIRTRTVTTLRTDAECPSLSPDGTKLVYKKRNGRPAGQWRLTALNLATGVETPLAETHSVDDQVAWLDGDHVLYARPGSGGDQRISDVWVVPADGTGTPRVLIPEASSPTVIR